MKENLLATQLISELRKSEPIFSCVLLNFLRRQIIVYTGAKYQMTQTPFHYYTLVT